MIGAPPYRWLALPGAAPLAAAATAAYFGIYGLIPIFAERIQTLEPARAGLWVGVLQSVTWGTTLLTSAWWGPAQRPPRAPGRHVRAAAGCALGVAGQAGSPTRSP